MNTNNLDRLRNGPFNTKITFVPSLYNPLIFIHHGEWIEYKHDEDCVDLIVKGSENKFNFPGAFRDAVVYLRDLHSEAMSVFSKTSDEPGSQHNRLYGRR